MSPLLKLFAGASLALAGASAHASGTVNLGGASPGSPQIYHAGKAVYARELACGSCAYAGAELTADLARRILSDRKTFGALDADQQEAVRVYFQKRFGVNGQ